MHLWLEKKLNIHPYIYLFPNYTPVVARCVHHTASLVYHTIFMFGKIDLKKKTDLIFASSLVPHLQMGHTLFFKDHWLRE